MNILHQLLIVWVYCSFKVFGSDDDEEFVVTFSTSVILNTDISCTIVATCQTMYCNDAWLLVKKYLKYACLI